MLNASDVSNVCNVFWMYANLARRIPPSPAHGAWIIPITKLFPTISPSTQPIPSSLSLLLHSSRRLANSWLCNYSPITPNYPIHWEHSESFHLLNLWIHPLFLSLGGIICLMNKVWKKCFSEKHKVKHTGQRNNRFNIVLLFVPQIIWSHCQLILGQYPIWCRDFKCLLKYFDSQYL